MRGAGKKIPWSEADDRDLRTLWCAKVSAEDIGDVLGRTAGAVNTRATHLGLHWRRKKIWTEEEKMFIVNYGPGKGRRWMARKLEVTPGCYDLIRKKLEIKGCETRYGVKGLRRTWHFGEEEWLKRHIDDYSWQRLGELLGHTAEAVRVKARSLGLKKGPSPGRRGYPPIEQYNNKPIKTWRDIY